MTTRYAGMMVAASALLATALWAQAPSPASGTSQAAANTPAASATGRTKTGGGEHADARVCLEFATNLQVIACAEKYRHIKPPA
jgi:hypothetical protein